MSSIIASPARSVVTAVTDGNGLGLTSGTLSMGAASAGAAGAMSAADKAKLDAVSGTNTGDVTLDGASTSWLTLVGQVLKLTLVAAGAAAEGIVTTGAQAFAGAKTFTSAIIASAGVQLSALWNTNGTGATDVCVKVGTSVADASVNASAKLISVQTGIGGTEVEKLAVLKAGTLVSSVTNTVSTLASATPAFDIVDAGGSAQSVLRFRVAGRVSGLRVDYLGNMSWHSGGGGQHAFYLDGTNDYPVMNMALTTGVGRVGIGLPAGTAAASCRLLVRASTSSGEDVQRWQNSGGTLMASISPTGRLDQSGTDSSGTPGAATIDKPAGKSAIAAGATSVRVTNSLVASGDQVHVTWHGDHGQTRSWVTTGAGFFDVNLNAAASANTAFCWTVSKRL